MKDRWDNLYKMALLATLAALGAAYHFASGLGFNYVLRPGIWFQGCTYQDGVFYMEPAWRMAGYLALASVALVVVFSDRVEKWRDKE